MVASPSCEPPFRLTQPQKRVAPLKRLFLGAAERVLAFPEMNRIHAAASSLPGHAEFCEKILEAMNIRSDVSDAELKRIPAAGPLIVVANHPFGGLEGMILAAILRRVRPNTKLLANYLLGHIPELRDLFIFVDPFGGANATTKNTVGMKSALRWLREGGVLGVFPAGEVSHLTWRNRCITDPAWSNTIGRLARQTGAPVLPVFFDGRNSRLFQAAGLIHPRLRTVLLPRELVGRQSTVVRLFIGATISPDRLRRFDNDADATAYLRLRTYLLKSRAHDRAALAQTSVAGIPPRVVPIVSAQPPQLVADEIARLPDAACLVQSREFDVFIARANELPMTLREIGRLRELTFRDVGEGTGREIDLDRFDNHYLHLFVWNRAAQEIVGAYRIGLSDELLKARGLDGFYTRTLFRYDARLLRQIGPFLEAGRSFVTAAYQKRHSALAMLWKGIGRFVVLNPRYRSIVGPVSISDRYHSMTKQLLMSFLQTGEHRASMHKLVRPTHPPRWGRFRDCDERLLTTIVRGIDDVDELVSEIESDHRGMPVLLRQYLNLNAKLLGFNIDPDFGDVLDGLVLIDITKIDRSILDYYLGREGAAAFLSWNSGSRIERT